MHVQLVFKSFHASMTQLGKWNALYADFWTAFKVLFVCVYCWLSSSGAAKERTDEYLLLPDFAEPLVVPVFGGAASSGVAGLGAVGLDNQPPEEMVSIIISMGFQRSLAIQALKATVSSIGTIWVLFDTVCFVWTYAWSDACEICI